MKNCDYWKRFARTGSIDDYLNYIACTREDLLEDPVMGNINTPRGMEKEGGFVAGINYRDGNGSVGHAIW
jgi:hypothetical protein